MKPCTNQVPKTAAWFIAAAGLSLASQANAQLHNNGPLSTGPTAENGTAAPAGTNWSECQGDGGSTTQANGTAGFGLSLDASTTADPIGGYRLADDFIVPPGQLWNVNGVSVFAYQTGQGAAATSIDVARVQIWRGPPNQLGSQIVFGDLTTNRLSGAIDPSLFRLFNSVVPPLQPVGTTRKIWQINMAANTALGPGTYWIDYQLSTLNGGSPFAPAVTIDNDRGLPGWNARQFAGPQPGGWVALLDGGTPAAAPDVPQDMPFIVNGAQGDGCSVPLKQCPADMAPIGGNGQVNVDDLLAVINTWGQVQNPPGAAPRPQGDVAPLPNGNCQVNVDDLLSVINGWGACPAPTGGCCLPNGTCQVLTEASCIAAAGNAVYLGDGVACGGVTCPVRPANDLCANAATANNGANNFNLANALNDGPDGPAGGCEDGIGRDVWFNYTSTSTGAVVFDTVGTVGTTDTVLAVYDGNTCVGTLLGCNDDIATGNLLSSVTANLTIGQQVKVRVASFGASQAGAGVLNISAFGNDICDGASPVTIGGSVNGSLNGATADPVSNCNGVSPGVGRWYTVVGNGNTLTANTCNGPAQLWDGRISVYCGQNCNDLNCVTAANTDSCNFLQESVSWCSAAGQTYWILVHSDAAPADGNYTLTVSSGAACGSPVACSCFSCPAGSVNEGETCLTAPPDNTNGGCNSTPAVFGSITVNGPAVCGKGSTYLNGTTQTRDTDWYSFTLAAPASVHIEASARFTALVGIVTNAGAGGVPPSNITLCGQAPQGAPAFVAGSTATTLANCTVLTSPTVNLQAGTYALFVGPSVFTGFPCGSSSDYWVRLMSP